MKKLIIVILLMNLYPVFGQNKVQKTAVTKFSIETDNLEELKNFKWNWVKKFFKENDKNDSIKIVLRHKKDTPKTKNGDFQLNGVTTEINGQAFELNKMIRTAKKMVKEIVKIEGELKH
jgi:hypothetical protein